MSAIKSTTIVLNTNNIVNSRRATHLLRHGWELVEVRDFSMVKLRKKKNKLITNQ
jgi:hypothetical protein